MVLENLKAWLVFGITNKLPGGATEWPEVFQVIADLCKATGDSNPLRK